MDVSQEFTFRNERHTQPNNVVLYEKLYQCYLQGKLTDVTLVSSEPDKQEFKCHKLILAAACEYFETMFSGNWRELHEDPIKLEDIDGDTLELFLEFAYRGVIIIDEENIYNAFCFSAIFEMKGLEDLCVRYLTERDIPMNCAIELFVFARAVHCTPLIPRLSQFIVNNLSEFPKGAGANGLLRMSLEDVEILLTNHRPLSQSKEVELWALLLYWTQEKYTTPWTVLHELVPLCQFDFVQPPQGGIQRLYDTTRLPRPSPVEIETEERLHLYVYNHDDANTCDLFKMYPYSDSGIFFHQAMKVALCGEWRIKTLAVGNQLYLYGLRPRVNEYDLLFKVYSSVSLTDGRPLQSPEDQFNFAKNAGAKRAFDTASISGDSIYQRMFLLHSLRPPMSKELFWYDCGSNTWYNIDYGENIVLQTYFDHRLFLFGRNRTVQTYDPRAGKWENQRESGLLHRDSDRLCVHRGKLYVAGSRERVNLPGKYHLEAEVYDPVADRWAEMPPTPVLVKPLHCISWLASLDNKLWVFGEINVYPSSLLIDEHPYNYRLQTFDPFSQKWGECRRLFKHPALGDVIKDIVVSWAA